MIIVLIAKILLNFVIVGLFLYSKLIPHKDKLEGQYRGLYTFFNNMFEPVTKLFRKFLKPVQVGRTLFVDISQILLLVLLLMVYELL